MPRLSKLIEKIEDRLANKWGCWYERNKARVPLYAVLGGIGWYLYGMFLNSLKLGKESVFNTTGEVIESIWVDPRLLEALDVMLELTKAQPGFYSKDGLHEPFLLRFTGNGKGAGYLFSVAWLDAATHIATVPRMKGERIIWISESSSFGEIDLPRHHFFAVRQEDGTHRFFGSNEPGKI